MTQNDRHDTAVWRKKRYQIAVLVLFAIGWVAFAPRSAPAGPDKAKAFWALGWMFVESVIFTGSLVLTVLLALVVTAVIFWAGIKLLFWGDSDAE